jgi:hypothetical protein
MQIADCAVLGGCGCDVAGTNTICNQLAAECRLFYLLCVQEARTLEEVQMQLLERDRVVAYFAYMQRQAAALAAAAADSHDQLVAVQQQQLEDAADLISAAKNLQQSVEQAAQLGAEHMIMQGWAAKFEMCRQDAIQRFAKLAM